MFRKKRDHSVGVGFVRELFSSVFILAIHTVSAASAATSQTTAEELT